MSDFKDIARDFLTKCKEEFDGVISQESIIEEGDNELSLLVPDYIQFAKYGRGPGLGPPIKNIIDFVESDGIIFDGQTTEGTAFLIQRSISEKGTSNWVENAPNFIEETFEKYKKEYDAELGLVTSNLISITYQEELRKFWDEEDKSLRTFKI